MSASSRRHVLALVVILLVGLAVRCRFVGDVFLEGRILPFDPDSSYHLWRIEDAVAAHGLPPRFDSFANAPEGAEIIIPDGFAAFMAAVVLVLEGAQANRFQVQVVSLLAMPLLGVLALLAIYALARRAFGRTEALWATAIAAFLPSHALAAIVGRVDHHVFELGLPPLALALILGERRLFARVLGISACIAALVYTVPVALLHVATMLLSSVVAAMRATISRHEQHGASILASAGIGLALAALLILPDSLGRSGFAFYKPSLLSLTLLAVAALGMVALAFAARKGARALVTLILALAVAAGVVAILLLKDAAGYVAGDGLLALVNEAMPLFSDPIEALEIHSLALPLLPLIFAAAMWRAKSPAVWGVGALGLVSFVFALFQLRFGLLLAPPAAICLGALAASAWQSARTRGRVFVIAALLLVLALPVRFFARATLLGVAEASILDASEWLGKNTPAAGRRSAREPAPYTILTMWGMGGHIAYLADRPVVVGQFHHGDFGRGLADSIQLLYGDGDPTELLYRRRVRYVVLSAQEPHVEGYHRELLGLGAPTKPSLYGQLFDFDGGSLLGSDGTLFPALSRFRLIHESPYTTHRGQAAVPALKIFERVLGAHLSGKCIVDVKARSRVRTDAGRDFEYLATAPCEDGVFDLRIPYPGALDLLGLTIGPASTTVTEEDVRTGSEIAVLPK